MGSGRTGDDGSRMKTGETDELKNEAGSTEIPDEGFKLFVRESMSGPIERRRQVVDHPSDVHCCESESRGGGEEGDVLSGTDFSNLLGEFLRLSEIGSLRLEPQKISLGGVSKDSFRRRLIAIERISTFSNLKKSRRRTSIPPLKW